MRLPETKTYTGQIVSVKRITTAENSKFTKDTSAIKVQVGETDIRTIFITDNQLKRYGLMNVIFVNNVVTMQVAENVAGETYYLQDGEEVLHDKTFVSFVDATSTSGFVLASVAFKLTQSEELAKMLTNSVLAERTAYTNMVASKASARLDSLVNDEPTEDEDDAGLDAEA